MAAGKHESTVSMGGVGIMRWFMFDFIQIIPKWTRVLAPAAIEVIIWIFREVFVRTI